jgi:hypothetical protein
MAWINGARIGARINARMNGNVVYNRVAAQTLNRSEPDVNRLVNNPRAP